MATKITREILEALRTSIGKTANSSFAQNRTQQSRTWYIGNMI